MFWQIPPELLRHAFLGLDVTIDRFSADAQFGTFIDHPIADLLGRPSLFDPFNHTLAQIRMSDQFALRGPPLLRALVRSHPEVSSVLLGEGIICPIVAFNLSEDRGFVPFQNPCHLGDRNLCKPPIFDPAAYLKAQLRVNRSHATFSQLDKTLFSNRSRTSK